MQTIDFESWDEFEKKIPSFFDQENKLNGSTPLFRGQSNASWKLETTLERFTKQTLQTFSTHDYYKIIRRVKPAIVSITEKEWGLRRFKESLEDKLFPTTIGYDFMVYLRHHGFPSPLLDWTRSPYIAAFFAFHPLQVQENRKIAIYSYVEFTKEGKLYCEQTPTVHGLGPYVETHKRHYAQQCEYTVCVKAVANGREYCSHEEAFSDPTSELGPLKKYTLPASERRIALKQLHRMNVTAFSLFGSEESLMETLAYQEIESKM